MAILDDGAVGSLGVTDLLDRSVERDAHGQLDEGLSRIRRYGAGGEVMGSELAVYIQAFSTQPRMVIFGAIDFSAEMAKLASEVGYRVTICDAREPVRATARASPRPPRSSSTGPTATWRARSSAPATSCWCSPTTPKFDEPALIATLATGAGYVGALGSRRTQDRRVERLREAGLDEQSIARIHAPCGLDVGARTPAETAVSILAEVIAVRTRPRRREPARDERPDPPGRRDRPLLTRRARVALVSRSKQGSRPKVSFPVPPRLRFFFLFVVLAALSSLGGTATATLRPCRSWPAVSTTRAGSRSASRDPSTWPRPAAAAPARAWPAPEDEGEVCVGSTGAVTKIWRGGQRRIVTGLPSVAGADGSATGPHDIALKGWSDAYVIVGLGGSPETRDAFGPLGEGLGHLYSVSSRGRARAIADLTGFEAAENPDGEGVDSNPYSVLSRWGKAVVADAGGNTPGEREPQGPVHRGCVPVPAGGRPPRHSGPAAGAADAGGAHVRGHGS